eukprot:s331_g15.t1
MEESELYDTFSEQDRREFLLRIFQHLIFGGCELFAAPPLQLIKSPCMQQASSSMTEKQRQMLRRLEANEKLREEHAKLVPREGRVTFLDIQADGHACVPSGSSTAHCAVEDPVSSPCQGELRVVQRKSFASWHNGWSPVQFMLRGAGEGLTVPDAARTRRASAVPGQPNLPDLLTNRRPKASDDKGKEASPADKNKEPQRGAEQDSSGSKEASHADKIEEPQRGAEQEAVNEKKQKAAEEREAFLRALMEEQEEAEREEMAAMKQEKHRQMLRRLEAINAKLREEHAKLVPREGRVTFLEGEQGPCVPSGSSATQGELRVVQRK